MINQVLSSVRDIVEGVENKFTEEDYLDVEEPGFFVAKIDQVKYLDVEEPGFFGAEIEQVKHI